MLLSQADNRTAARLGADEALSQLSVPRDSVEALWGACRAIDREGCGRLTVGELGRAFDRAGVQLTPQQMAALASGLRDNVGLLGYQDLVKVLLTRARNPGSDARMFGSATATSSRPVSAVVNRSAVVKLANGAPPRPANAMARSVSFAPPTRAMAPLTTGSEVASEPSVHLGTAPSPPPGTLAAFQISDPSSWSPPPAHAHTMSPEEPTRDHQRDQHNHSSPPMEPEGTFHPFKAQAYWFGGVDPAEVQSQEAAAWTASGDKTHKVTAYHIGEDIAAARNPPVPVTTTNSNNNTVMMPILDSPTVSSALKSGRLTQAELEQQIEAKHSSATQHQRPWSASPRSSSRTGTESGPQHEKQSILAVATYGASLGSTLKGSAMPVGSGALQTEPDVIGRGSMRPMSARSGSGASKSGSAAESANFWGGASGAVSTRPPAGLRSSRPASASARLSYGPGYQSPSFSAVAHSQGGPKMEMLHRQMTKSDIAAVRALF